MNFGTEFAIIDNMQQKYLGKFIKETREKLLPKVSLNSFAFANDIEPATLSRIERCLQKVTLDEISNIAFGFNMKASELINEYEINYKD